MAPHLIVQGSGAIRGVRQPEASAFYFGIFVTDEKGTPVQGLQKSNFSVWDLYGSDFGEVELYDLAELNAFNPASHMPGIYRLQTQAILPGGLLLLSSFCALSAWG
jgi:hypothetical protein